ncbi:hypothetical protein BDL97_11G052600 [Sphagnum fallax]|nr:hypothetical protein BDL97_11G052600 [Sphagnum fallax]
MFDALCFLLIIFFMCNSSGSLYMNIVVDGAAANSFEAFYAFGDSYVDTGNGGYMGPPYGMTWPGHAAGRPCDGRNQVDHFAMLFGLPSPTPFKQMKNNESVGGINFGRSGGGVTYAFGYTPLDTQVDEFEALVQEGVLLQKHLSNSVALVCLAVNDYSAYNSQGSPLGVPELITTVVDGIALNIMRIHQLGIRNIIVADLVLMACMPYITASVGYAHCSHNQTLRNETTQHNLLLERRVNLLNQELAGSSAARIIIVDQTKAFWYLMHEGASKYGFADHPLSPCCTDKKDSRIQLCGNTDSEGRALYKVCKEPSQRVIFDGIHPTDAAWKAAIHLYSSVSGYTRCGAKLNTWISQRQRV